jgi:hypothetical protein
MKYWAIIPPLASFNQGHMQNPLNHPLHDAGCFMKSLWITLTDLYQSIVAAQADVLSSQYKLSIAFDNWQQMIQKVWQTHGSSSNYLIDFYLIEEKKTIPQHSGVQASVFIQMVRLDEVILI